MNRKRDSSGMLIGTHHNNPKMDSREYQVQFPDGSHSNYSDNLLLENLHSQVDEYGNIYELLQSIIDYRAMEDTIPKENGWVQSASGDKKRIITTRGWNLLVKFKDGTTVWRPLSELKEANPIELAEYTRSRDLESEPKVGCWTKTYIRLQIRLTMVTSSHHTRLSLIFLPFPERRAGACMEFIYHISGM